MKSYFVVKKLSKSLVLLSLLAIVISGGSFFVSKSKIGADTTPAPVKDYEIVLNGDRPGDVISSNITASEVTGYDYSANPNADIRKYTENCSLGPVCYAVKNTNLWKDASIEVDGKGVDRGNKPAWAFLLEVNDKAVKKGDTVAVGQIKEVITNYVIGAYAKNLQVYINFTSDSGEITIPYQEFYNKIKEEGIAETDPYVDFYDQGGKKMAKMKFAPSFPGATSNSAWLKAAEFVVGSMIKPYKDSGLDASDIEGKISAAKRNYVLSITKEDKTKVLTFKYPANLLLSKKTENLFEYKIDASKLEKPISNYKTKIYIRPASAKDESVYIVFGPFTESSKQFSWEEATRNDYNTAASGDDYNLDFPQKYLVHVVLVTADGDTEIDNLLATIQTQTEATTGAEIEVSASNSKLKISAKPVAVKQGGKATATIVATGEQIKKVVFYACTGTASTLLDPSNDSSTCTYKNEDGAQEDAVKASFEGPNLVFKDGKATLTASWDTSGSAIGNHALMAKAFAGSGFDQYIEGSKTAVTVQVTNSEVGDIGAGGDSGSFSNLLADKFNKKASDSLTGSSLRTTGELATRIVDILLIIIGALSIIAIIVGGIFYITAGGDQKKAERGKKTVLYACIGIALATLTYVVEGAIINIINDLVK